MLKRFLLLAIFLVGAVAPARTPILRPLHELIAYPEFESLLLDCVARVPELQPLWNEAPGDRASYYFGGGGLRGLVRWIQKELRNHTPAEIRKTPVPSIDELLILKNADRDVWAPDEWKERLQTGVLKGWDVLDESFFRGSVLAGGAAIEKTRVNPWKIDDPLGGLHSYYDGKLVFRLSPRDEFEKGAQHGLTDNTQTALALRFLRLARDLPKSTEPTPESLEAIRRIPEIEGALNIAPDNYWIRKGLWKLYESTLKSSANTLGDLKRAGLLDMLSKKGFVLAPLRGQESVQVDAAWAWREQGFTMDDFETVSRLIGREDGSAQTVRTVFLEMATTFDDYARIIGSAVRPEQREALVKELMPKLRAMELIKSVKDLGPFFAALSKANLGQDETAKLLGGIHEGVKNKALRRHLESVWRVLLGRGALPLDLPAKEVIVPWLFTHVRHLSRTLAEYVAAYYKEKPAPALRLCRALFAASEEGFRTHALPILIAADPTFAKAWDRDVSVRRAVIAADETLLAMKTECRDLLGRLR